MLTLLLFFLLATTPASANVRVQANINPWMSSPTPTQEQLGQVIVDIAQWNYLLGQHEAFTFFIDEMGLRAKGGHDGAQTVTSTP